jgi:hypothetical protein
MPTYVRMRRRSFRRFRRRDFLALRYEAISDEIVDYSPLEEQFDESTRKSGLARWLEVARGIAGPVAAAWMTPVDVLLSIGGNRSQAVSRSAYPASVPWQNARGHRVSRLRLP